MLKPLSEEIKTRIGAYEYEIYGPFGLRASTTVYFRERERKEGEKEYEVPSTKLTIIPVNIREGIFNYDTGEKRQGYEKGSIGQLNGFDNIEARLPENIEDIIKLLR